ncbi:MAG: fimbrillin family protein [Bacteroidales bacterium]|nr:fimbrillin family protein [Bacteroidales bacterium]
MKIELFYLSLICLLIASCEGEPISWNTSENQVNFSANIERLTTRASDDTWHKNDKIGVYMKEVDKSFVGTTFNQNAKYINNSGNYSFTPATEDDALYFPSDGKSADFIAYYPYREVINDFKYPIDISSQINLPDIDFMYSNNATDISKHDGEVVLSFSHQLSKIAINIRGYAPNNLRDLRVVITNVATKAMFDLNTGKLQPASDFGDVELIVKNEGFIEAILLPENDISQKEIWLIFDGDESMAYRYSLKNEKNISSFQKSTRYTYNISINEEDMAQSVQGSITDWLEGPVVDVVAELTEQAPPSIKGSKSSPYSIAEAQTNQGKKDVWVYGYIVGSFTGNSVKSFTSDVSSAKHSVIAISDTKYEVNTDAILPVELPAGKVRDALNILNNPSNIGRKIKVKGSLEKYYSAPGLKGPKEFTFST